MDRKACCDAEIIECINRIIEKDNDKLYDKLKKMGIAFAAMTVQQISLLEKRIATAMKKWHKSEKTSLLNSESLFSFLSSHTTESEADAELVQAVSQAVEETCGDVLQASADQYIRQTDAELSVTEISAPTAAAVSEASVQAGTSVLRHVTDEISNIIQEAINNGDSVDDAAKRIFDGGLRDEYYEARRVAQTEMMRTHAYAKYEALRQSPVVNAKRWRHTGAKGAASRENHVNISGQTVPKDQPFTLTGRDGTTYHPMLPHDTALPAAEAINCHCILEAVIDKDFKSLPPEQKAQMQRDNIRMLNENYAEKSGKYKQIAGLPVDNQENGGIIESDEKLSELGKFKQKIRLDKRMGDKYYKATKNKFSHGTDNAKAVFNKYVPVDSVANSEFYGNAYYSPKSKKIYMSYASDLNNDRGTCATWFHEHGHMIDDIAGNVSNNADFRKALDDDYLSYMKQYGKKNNLGTFDKVQTAIGKDLSSTRKHSAVCDLLNGLSKGNIKGVSYHRPEYWSDDSVYCSEAFAHMYEAQFDKIRYDEMKQYFPTALKKFEDMLGGLI